MMMMSNRRLLVFSRIIHVLNIAIAIAMAMACMVLNTTSFHTNTILIHPIVIIPGSGGNQLEARLNYQDYKPSSLLCKLLRTDTDTDTDTSTNHGIKINNNSSNKKDGWFRLWFDLKTVLLSPLTRCFAERMTLYYHKDEDDYRNAPGVETRAPFFGSTKGLLYLDPHFKHISEYMATLVKSLEQIGYRDGHNLYGAPYDFRYGLAAPGHPSQIGSKYLHDLQQLIESASASNGAKPVILLSHSLGSLFALQLLARVDPVWRAKHIKHLVALSPPWGGTVQEMLTFGSGYTLGIPLVNPLVVRGEQRSSESNMWLLPSPTLFGSRPLVIVTSNNKSYSAKDIPEFLNDIGFEEGVYPYRTRILPLVNMLADPRVNVSCIIGSGVDTAETLVYGTNNGGFDVQPDVVYGDGDGTVNMLSLLWLQSEFPDVVKVVKIPGVSHTSILKDDVAVNKIIEEISDINSINIASKSFAF